MSTPATQSPAGSSTLACMNCGDQRTLQLDRGQLAELIRSQQLRLHCSHCQSLTSWSAVEADRRTEQPRRTSRRVRMELPIRVRAEAPNSPLTEVTRTVDLSRDGACFRFPQPLREGSEIFVRVPFDERDNLPETRARVVRSEQAEEGWLVAVEFVQSRRKV